MAKRKSTSIATSTKRITVGTAHYPVLQADWGRDARERAIPYIRLRGLWLSAAGFAPSDPISVDVSNGRIVLRRA